MGRWLLTLALLLLLPAWAESQGPVVIRGHATGTGANVNHANALLVHVMGKIDCDTCGGGGATGASVTSHISSVTHVAAAGPLPVVQSPHGVPWNVTAHQGGAWTVAHVSSVTHAALVGGFVSTNQMGAWAVTAHAGTGSLTVNQGGLRSAFAHQAGVWTISHISSVVHVAAAGPLPVVQSPQQGAWNVTAHQAGEWNVRHVTSVTHVALVADYSGIPTSGSAGGGNMVCHSRANFSTTANGIIAHGKTGLRLYICGVFIVGDGLGTDVSLVEGTAAACGTGTTVVLGSTVAVMGVPLGYHALSIVHPTPWIATQTTGNQLCILTSSAATRVVGVVIYGAY